MKKILVIEDNIEVRENTCEILELSGYEVFSAENGKDGVQEAIEKLPDLIICDVMMPILDGYGALKILNKNPKTNHIPFIFLTAKAEKEDFRKGMNMGADDYITKPFTDVELLEAIEIRLEKHKNQTSTTVHNVFFNVENHFEKVLEIFLKGKEVRTYNKKDLLFKEESHPRSVFFIKSGKAQTFKINDYGKELTLSLYGKNDFVGITDAFRGSPYQESAIAVEDSEIILIAKEEFMDWLRSDNSIAQHFIRLLAIKSGEKDNLLLELAYSSVRKRVAESLLRLYKHYKSDDESSLFEINILREELAHIVGTTKETVTRTLSEFKDEELIDIKGSKITLLDIEGLAATPA